ncbi:MAG: hypothetical protein NTW01_15430 [Gammaproteobacteria bacterium]|nr:hypothetical protein [Gammaproteobacteria bacterium]
MSMFKWLKPKEQQAPTHHQAALKGCELSFECNLKWEQLAPTLREQVRHCSQCSKSVHLVHTREEFGVAVRFKRCVAISDNNNFVGVIGDTAGSMDWMESEWPEMQLRLNTEPTADIVLLLQEMYPALMLNPKSEAELLQRLWVSLGTLNEPEAKALVLEATTLGLPVEFRANAAQPSVPPDVPASAASPLRPGRG